MIGRLRQLSEPKLRQQAGVEKSQTLVERDILVQWVRNKFTSDFYQYLVDLFSSVAYSCVKIQLSIVS